MIAVLLASMIPVIGSSTTPNQDTRVTREPNNKTQFEPAVAVSPLNRDIVIVTAMDLRDNFGPSCSPSPCPWVYYYVTCDNWLHSNNVALPGSPNDPDPAAPLRRFTGFTGDVSVAFDPAGNVYITGLGYSSDRTYNGVFLAKGVPNCGTLSNPKIDFTPSNIVIVADNHVLGVPLDKPYMTVDAFSSPVRIYIAWMDTANSKVYFAYSDDGSTFTLSGGGPIYSGQPCTVWFPVPAAGPNSAVYVAYFSAAPLTCSYSSVTIQASFDGGRTFSQSNSIVSAPKNAGRLTNVLANTPPVLSIAADLDSASGRVYLVWDDVRDFSTKGSEILFTSSADTGRTWSTPATVNDDPTNTNQFWPWLVSPVSRQVDVIFYSSTSTSPPQVDLYYSHSNDGVSFQSSLKVSDSSFNPNLDLSDCSNPQAPIDCKNIGDYIGLASGFYSSISNIIIQPVWTGSRDGVYTDIYVDRIIRLVKVDGDVNNDCNVNIIDLVSVGAAYGSTPSSSNWNSKADLNKDDAINITDLNLVGSNFGKSCLL